MKTIIDVECMLGVKLPDIEIGHGYHIHFLETVLPGINFDLLGDLFFTTLTRQRPEQHFFIISVNGEITSESTMSESHLAYELAERTEQHYHDDQLKVIDVALPKSHGFSGTRHNCRQLKQLYAC